MVFIIWCLRHKSLHFEYIVKFLKILEILENTCFPLSLWSKAKLNVFQRLKLLTSLSNFTLLLRSIHISQTPLSPSISFISKCSYIRTVLWPNVHHITENRGIYFILFAVIFVCRCWISQWGGLKMIKIFGGNFKLSKLIFLAHNLFYNVIFLLLLSFLLEVIFEQALSSEASKLQRS